jgi:hypothetical protein
MFIFLTFACIIGIGRNCRVAGRNRILKELSILPEDEHAEAIRFLCDYYMPEASTLAKFSDNNHIYVTCHYPFSWTEAWEWDKKKQSMIEKGLGEIFNLN